MLSTFFIVIQGRKSINAEMRQIYKQNIAYFIETMDTRFQTYYDMLQHLCTNTTVHAAMTNSIGENSAWVNGAVISGEINKYIRFDKSRGLENCIIYSEIADYPIYHQKATTQEYVRYEEWYALYKDNNKDRIFYKTSSNNSMIMSLILPVVATEFGNPYYGQRLGFIKLDINLNDFFHSFIPVLPENIHTFFILSENNTLLYTSNMAIQTQYIPEITEKIKNRNDDGILYKVPNSHTDLFVLQKLSSHNGLKVIMFFNNDALKNKFISISKITVLLACISIVLVFFFAYYLSGKIAIRVNALIAKMKQVEHGNLEITGSYSENEDEIGIIEQQFYKMVVRLKKAIEQNYIAEIEKREASLRLLQFQINPHFLYNTLEAVSAIAMKKKVYIICEITQKLSEMFRYAVSKQHGEAVSFAEELQHIENYIFIQKVRFPHLFVIQYDIPAALYTCLMPCFTIQPLVENAVNHGLKEHTQGGIIKISAYAADNALFICVKDNGTGMNAEKLRIITADLQSSDNKNKIGLYKQSIGLKNVHTRIQTAYGKTYGINIESTQSAGTSVTVKIPIFRSSEETHVQHTYS